MNNSNQSVIVEISSTALALILFDCVKAECAEDGFLLGSTEVNTSEVITDEGCHVLKTEKCISVKASIPCRRRFMFYNGVGELIPEALDGFLKDLKQHVIGWYTSTEFDYDITLRERIVHKELSKYLNLPIDTFTMCVLKSGQMPVLENSQQFLRYTDGSFAAIPIYITNLDKPKLEYVPSREPSALFRRILQTVRNSPEPGGISAILTALNSYLVNATGGIAEMEETLSELEEEVQDLQSRARLAEDDSTDEGNSTDANMDELILQ